MKGGGIVTIQYESWKRSSFNFNLFVFMFLFLFCNFFFQEFARELLIKRKEEGEEERREEGEGEEEKEVAVAFAARIKNFNDYFK